MRPLGSAVRLGHLALGGIALAMAAGHWRNGIGREEYLRIVPPAMQRYPVQEGEGDGTRSP